jgi:hypothetical protein
LAFSADLERREISMNPQYLQQVPPFLRSPLSESCPKQLLSIPITTRKHPETTLWLDASDIYKTNVI